MILGVLVKSGVKVRIALGKAVALVLSAERASCLTIESWCANSVPPFRIQSRRNWRAGSTCENMYSLAGIFMFDLATKKNGFLIGGGTRMLSKSLP